MTHHDLAREIESFLLTHPQAVVLDDGIPSFDLSSSRFSLSTEHNKCVLHLWSAERNSVRRVLDTEQKNGVLRLTVQKFGQAKPSKLEICPEKDRRTPTARRAARAAYQRLLAYVLQRHDPGAKIEKLSSAMDLEHSFGPTYTRALLRKGRNAWAVLGVNAQETQASVDASLTFGLLWLHHCREKEAGRSVVEGLKLFVPPGSASVVRARMAQLDHTSAKFQLITLDEREQSLEELDVLDGGNVETRLVRCADEAAIRERFASVSQQVLGLVPPRVRENTQQVVLSSSQIAYRLFGLEYARARVALKPNSFSNKEKIVFGAGPYERELTDDTAIQFADLMVRVAASRHQHGNRNDILFRMAPERWLESLVTAAVTALDQQLDSRFVYSQVPAFAASDRAMIDVLAATQSRRLAVIELKADEDIHLPLQGLDYWARVDWHQRRGEFQKFGYFPGVELSSERPLLMLVAPALHVHPATDILLRYLSPEIEWNLVALDEHWRDGIRVVFRRSRQSAHAARHG